MGNSVLGVKTVGCVDYRIRPFVTGDAAAVSRLIGYTMGQSNREDYPEDFILRNIRIFTPEYVLKRADWTHFYVVCSGKEIVGCGAIGPYWGSQTESSLFTVFVHPEHQGYGLGRWIVEVLEQDEFFLRASRVEIPASITACQFYRKLGYDLKNGQTEPDEEGLYRLEKFRA